MAKKVVATLKTGTGKQFTKCIKMVKSEKTGAYMFKEGIMPTTRSRRSSRRRNKYFRRNPKYKGHPDGVPFVFFRGSGGIFSQKIAIFGKRAGSAHTTLP